MKMIRSLSAHLLAFGLVLCLLAGAVAPVRAAELNMDELFDNLATAFSLTQKDRDNYDKTYDESLPIEYEQTSKSYYVALGGDTAGGTAGISDPTKCYADQVAAKLKLEYGENYRNETANGLSATNAVSHITRKKSTIAKADLITFQLDGAPFIISSMDGVYHGTEVNWKKYITDSQFLTYIRAFRSQMTAEYAPEYGEKDAKNIAIVLEYMLYECVSYGYETLNAVEEIRKINSNAVVLVLGLYNPLRGLSFTADGKTINIGDMIDQMIDVCNVFLLTRTLNMKNTAFIDVSDASTIGFGNMDLDAVNGDLQSQLFDITTAIDKQYANQKGHDYMRDQVLSSLREPCKHTKTTTKNAKAATCKSEGYTGDTVCASCGEVIKTGAKTAKTAHKYGAWTQTKAPTCTEKGEETRTCTVCGHKETRSVSTLAHKFDKGTVTKEPGCESKGVKTYKCTNTGCTHTKTEDIPATGHSFDNGTVTKEPGCESKGVKTYKCTNTGCTHTKTEDIPAIGHSFDNGTVTKEPGCESKGVKTYKCTNTGCTHTKTEDIPATGHSFDNGTVTKEPGCESKGVKTYKCTNTGCTHTKTEDIPATGHSFDNETVTKEPGCETEGEKAVTCTSCGKATTETIPATGHTWNSGTVTKEPGCETEGEKAVTCTSCGKATTETIPATGHTWDNGTVTKEPGCETEGEKAVTCTSCNTASTEVVPATGHTWDNGTVTREPGCETVGGKTFICTSCNAVTTETIPATGHHFGDYISNGDATCEKDGTQTAVCEGCGVKDTVEDPSGQTDHAYENGVCTFCGVKQPSNTTILWIVSVSAAVVIIGGGVLGFWLFKKKRSPQ